ncbi:MAG: hypothetical protein U0R64_05330 [Candidatus Nanopelagicales bacterium]
MKRLAIPMSGLVAVATLMSVPAAHADTQLFLEDFESCGATGDYATLTGLETAKGSPDPTYVTLDLIYPDPTPVLACPDWTEGGQAWFATYESGTAFPSPTRAAWLNEGSVGEGGQGYISRNVSGLTPGTTYRLSAIAWTDNVDAPTALNYSFGPLSGSLPMSAGSGQQSLEGTLCASSTTLDLTLSGSNDTGASPVVDNVKLEDVGAPCVIVADRTMSMGVGAGDSVDLSTTTGWDGNSPPSPPNAVTYSIVGGTYSGQASLVGSTLSYTADAADAGRTVVIDYRVCPTGVSASPPCSDAKVSVTVSNLTDPTARIYGSPDSTGPAITSAPRLGDDPDRYMASYTGLIGANGVDVTFTPLCDDGEGGWWGTPAVASPDSIDSGDYSTSLSCGGSTLVRYKIDVTVDPSSCLVTGGLASGTYPVTTDQQSNADTGTNLPPPNDGVAAYVASATSESGSKEFSPVRLAGVYLPAARTCPPAGPTVLSSSTTQGASGRSTMRRPPPATAGRRCYPRPTASGSRVSTASSRNPCLSWAERRVVATAAPTGVAWPRTRPLPGSATSAGSGSPPAASTATGTRPAALGRPSTSAAA